MSLEFIQGLIHCLERENQACSQLVALLEDEKQILISSQKTALMDNLHAQEQCFADIQQLEKERSQLMTTFSRKKQVTLENLTLTRLIPMVMNAGLRGRLQELHQQLKAKIHQIQHLGERNRILIQQATDFIDYSIELFSDVITNNRNKIYSPYGNVQSVSEDYQMLSYNA